MECFLQKPPGDTLQERWFFRRRNFHQYACRYYPRYLRPHQNINPYLVFEGCAKWLSLKDWENLLDDMLTAATSRKNIYDVSSNKRVYELSHAPLKLL